MSGLTNVTVSVTSLLFSSFPLITTSLNASLGFSISIFSVNVENVGLANVANPSPSF